MGAGQSLLNKSLKNVFSEELSTLTDIVNNIITPDGKFTNPDYNFLFEEVCSKYTILWEKELNKHLKVDLENFAGSIYLIPKKDLISVEEQKIEVSKQDLCQKISKHYIKLLYVFSLIKTVYDLEHAGDDSIAGIMQRNVKIVNDIMEISYCSIPQKDYDLQPGNKINFEHLQGFKVFVEHFLTPLERRAFLEQFRAIFARKPRHKIVDAICHDALVPLDEYEAIYADRLKGKIHCKEGTPSRKQGDTHLDLMFEVSMDNPILHTHFCFSHKKLIVPIKGSDENTKQVYMLYRKMHQNYTQNVDNVVNILYKIIDKKGKQFTLKNISSQELHDIITEVKRNIIKFYVQSIVDFQNLLDVAKTIPNITDSA
jgi:hypothetical protein